jgi:hypothetical protein
MPSKSLTSRATAQVPSSLPCTVSVPKLSSIPPKQASFTAEFATRADVCSDHYFRTSDSLRNLQLERMHTPVLIPGQVY